MLKKTDMRLAFFMDKTSRPHKQHTLILGPNLWSAENNILTGSHFFYVIIITIISRNANNQLHHKHRTQHGSAADQHWMAIWECTRLSGRSKERSCGAFECHTITMPTHSPISTTPPPSPPAYSIHSQPSKGLVFFHTNRLEKGEVNKKVCVR